MIMIEEILKATENLERQLNCEKCQVLCDVVPYRIRLCGHIHCSKCISAIDHCSKCKIKFDVEDIFVDNSLGSIFSGINVIAEKLRKNNKNKSQTLTSSCIVNQSEQNESRHILDSCPHEDRYLNLNCDCSNFIEFKDDTNPADNVDKKSSVGETKLHRACKKGNETEVEELLNAGASVNAQDYAYWTPLHESIIVGNTNIIEWLIEKGSVVNAPGDNYDTPLHKAIYKKDIEIAKILVKNGADINSKNYEGISPWDIADSDMKFALNKIDCKSIPLQIPVKINFNVFILGKLTEELEENIAKLNKKFQVNISSELNENVTHVILEPASKIVKPSYALLIAILYCIPIVSSEWLQTCVTLSKLVSCKEYFIIGTEDFQCDVVHRTQINKYKLNPKLFSGCHIYLGRGTNDKMRYTLSDTTLTACQVRQLITIGGGTLLKREPLPGAIVGLRQPWHATPGSTLSQCTHYVLYDPKVLPELRYNMKELKHVPYNWVFESILRYQLVVPEQLLYKQD